MNTVRPLLRRLGRGCPTAVLGVLCLFFAGGAGGQVLDELPLETPADAAYWPPETGRELLALDEPMRRFFSTRVHRNGSDGECLREIVTAILRPEGLGFTYESEGTYDAREAFRRRRGNCQGFAFLVVAVARSYGLRVQFQDVGTFQTWNRYDRFIATVRHTNVRMTTAYMEQYVVDLRPDLGQPTFISDRYIVSDERAFAHFYSTAGFFRLVHGDPAGALHLMKRGTELDPASPVVWTNLGSLQVQLGELAPARACFEKALRLDVRREEALLGLVNVLRRQGGPEELKLAAKHERRAQAYRDRNPYYAYHLASQAKLRDDRVETERRLRQAIRLKGDEPLFHEELIALLRQGARTDEVQRAESKLAKLRERLAQGYTFIMP